MLVCHKPQFIYLPSPKCGSASVCAMFKKIWPCREPGGRHLADWDVLERCRETHPVVISVRNPYSRVASYWNWMRTRSYSGDSPRRRELFERVNRGQQPFLAFMRQMQETVASGESLHGVLQPITKLYSVDDQLRVSHTLRLESLRRDIKALPFWRRTRVPLLTIHKTKYPAGDWWRQYEDNAEVIAFVRNYYAEDFERFGYSTELST